MRRSAGALFPTGERELANDFVGFAAAVGFEDVLCVDRAEVFVGGGGELAVVDQLRDAGEDIVLLDHVFGFEERAGEHELPADRDTLEFKRAAHVDVCVVFGDEHDAALRGDHFADRFPDAVDVVVVGDVMDGFEAERFELRGHVAVVANDVVGAEFAAPIGTFRARSGGDDGEAGELCELDGHGTDAACAANDE